MANQVFHFHFRVLVWNIRGKGKLCASINFVGKKYQKIGVQGNEHNGEATENYELSIGENKL